MRGPLSKSSLANNVCKPSLGQFVKSLTQRSEDRGLACVLFPASDRDIDVLGVKLDWPRASPGLFRGDQDRSTATKGIENETASLGAILDRIGNHGNRLHRRMHGQFLHSSCSHRIYTVVVPYVRAMPAMLAKFESIQVRSRAVLPHKDELVLGAVECAHSGVGLIPDADVLKLRVVGVSRCEHFSHMAPIHADLVDRAVGRILTKRGVNPGEEGRELTFAHFPRSHGKFTVLHAAQA